MMKKINKKSIMIFLILIILFILLSIVCLIFLKRTTEVVSTDWEIQQLENDFEISDDELFFLDSELDVLDGDIDQEDEEIDNNEDLNEKDNVKKIQNKTEEIKKLLIIHLNII